MTQHTYCGLTSAAILRTARIEEMMAGNFEVVVTVPRNGRCQADLVIPDSGASPVLSLSRMEGHVATLTMSSKSYETLDLLVRDAESKTMEHLRALGYGRPDLALWPRLPGLRDAVTEDL